MFLCIQHCFYSTFGLICCMCVAFISVLLFSYFIVTSMRTVPLIGWVMKQKAFFCSRISCMIILIICDVSSYYLYEKTIFLFCQVAKWCVFLPCYFSSLLFLYRSLLLLISDFSNLAMASLI